MSYLLGKRVESHKEKICYGIITSSTCNVDKDVCHAVIVYTSTCMCRLNINWQGVNKMETGYFFLFCIVIGTKLCLFNVSLSRFAINKTVCTNV